MLENLVITIGSLNNLESFMIFSNSLTSLPESICNLPYECVIRVFSNNLCEEYHFDCLDDNAWGNQTQSSCCEGVNNQGETIQNWTECAE